MQSSVDILVKGPQRMEKITGKAFKISFQPDWQTDNGFLNTPIMVHTQTLIHK